MNEFRIRLRLLRQESDKNQEELGLLIGFSRSAIGSWERGVSEPDIDSIIRLADYFHVTIDYLMGRSDIRQPDPTANLPDPYRRVFREVIENIKKSAK